MSVLSVCICTRDRAASLAETLLTVVHALAGIEGAFEVLVVDNGSRDATAEVAHRFTRLLPLRYVREPRPGLSHARNTAVARSRGALLAFTDDDVLWTGGALAALAATAAAQPQAGFFGGRILPWWEAGPPRWLHDPGLDLIAGVLAHYSPDTRARALTAADPLPFGANFALRRHVLDAVGGFDPELGAIGDRRRRGEETDLLARAVRLGFTGYYAADALCLHRVDPRNLSLRRLYALGIEKGRCAHGRGAGRAATRAVQTALALRGLAQVAKGRGDRFRQCVVRIGIAQGLLERGRD